MLVEAYLYFNGLCDEAIDFYVEKLGAVVTFLMRFKDSPTPDLCPVGAEHKVMHANLKIGETTVMMSDGDCEGDMNFAGFSLSISLTDESIARQLFNALAETGKVQLPLSKTFWSPAFGSVTDRFGVSWNIHVVDDGND